MPKTVDLLSLNFIFTENSFIVDTHEGELSDHAKEWSARFDNDRYDALYQLSFSEKESWFAPSMLFLHRLSDAFIRALTRLPELELLRERAIIVPDTDVIYELLESLPYGIGTEHVNEAWIENIFRKLNEVYARELSAYVGTAELYLVEKNQKLRVPGRIFFHLVENKNEDMPFAFMATYATKIDGGHVKHLPLRYALSEYESDHTKLLTLISSLGKAAQKSDLISAFMESGELFHPLKLTADEAYVFLKEIPLYEESGILCRIPNWWKRSASSVSITVSIGSKKPSNVGFQALLTMLPQLSVDGTELSAEEVSELLLQVEGLAFLKGKWVEINHEKLQSVLEIYKNVLVASEEGVTLADALRMELNPTQLLKTESDGVQITNGEWLRELRQQMKNPQRLEKADLPDSFNATLRPYQETGWSWLSYMRSLGFGACLADDMGLGKTVQVLALLEQLHTSAGGPILLVVPASLIGNWQKEIHRFAPDIEYKVLHGKTSKQLDLDFDSTTFLTITTYAMVSRLETLRTIQWDMIILDEAQAIKNPGAKQTKSIKLLKGSTRIALTGTPIENNLSDLWSLFDFINSGLLGTSKEFSGFAKKLTDDPTGYSRLKNIVSPFILRRLKTDKSIINDLPDKSEMRTYISLSKKQTVLYRKLVSEFAESLEKTDGIQRKGMILAAIQKLKQICNHPDQYLGQGAFIPNESGKFDTLRELCETIYEKRERVLIFTQFREMTEPLNRYLESIFHKKGLILHGGVPVKKRTELVDCFNGEDYVPYMVLSLKAGGVGLNLTAANHVIHFDRWWNPAVENQATDRAFRIGQKKNVMVYKMISTGTIEEKIDAMIAEKSKLLDDVIGSGGETWITEMSDADLLRMLKLEGEVN